MLDNGYWIWYTMGMNITRAILELRIDYAEIHGYNPIEINGGSCMVFAAEIANMGFGQAVWGDSLDMDLYSDNVQQIENWLECYAYGHCFIWYGGKFYDSECPQGCDYPDDLPFFKRRLLFRLEEN